MKGWIALIIFLYFLGIPIALYVNAALTTSTTEPRTIWVMSLVWPFVILILVPVIVSALITLLLGRWGRGVAEGLIRDANYRRMKRKVREQARKHDQST